MLIVESGHLAGQRWLLDRDIVIIGRDAERCDLILPDRQISRQHARIERTPAGFLLTDLGSKNGTSVNSSLLNAPHLLQDGDEITLALSIKLVFVGSDETAPLNAHSLSKAKLTKLCGICIDKQSRRVFVAGQEIDPPLSLQQYRLLEALVDAQGGLVSRTQLVQRIWGGTDYIASEQALDALVRRLRERIADYDPHHEYIVTVRGHGLRFEDCADYADA
jgi:predicted component of type VI protein secretion system